jgi:predicted NodU family carbamoyl transferase
MRDGYYLSAYIHIGELAHLGGVYYRHDQNISLWKKTGDRIELIHYWELERLTGMKKHWRSFYNPEHARSVINQLLKKYHITIDDCIEVWGTPLLQTAEDYHSLEDYPKLEYHSICHLFSAILSDTELFRNETIICLALDGGPDKVLEMDNDRKFFCGCVVEKGVIQDVFPLSSPGPLWNTTSNNFQLREGTLMALATACNAYTYLEMDDDDLVIDDLLSIKHKDAAMKKYLSNLYKTIGAFTEEDEGVLFNGIDRRFSFEENKISMIMKEIHKTSVKMVIRQLDDILERYCLKGEECCLSMTGGYALNCPTNSLLMQKYGFKKFISVPCVSDCGISLGIALYAFYKKMKQFHFKLDGSYYGDEDEASDETLSAKYHAHIQTIRAFDCEQGAEDLSDGPVLWFNGRAEIGPRALGNRSLLADPRVLKSKEQLNILKQRQWWRPVAPIVLEEELEEWFIDAYPSPYMLHNFQIREDKSDIVPAIVHLDGSARVQTINEHSNPLLYQLIRQFKKRTGVPIICNTSLNDLGEPIVNTIEEAMNFALRKQVGKVYINGKRLELDNFIQFTETKPAQRPVRFMEFISEEEKQQKSAELNPFYLSQELLNVYFSTKELMDTFNLINQSDVKGLLRMYKLVNKVWFWDAK